MSRLHLALQRAAAEGMYRNFVLDLAPTVIDRPDFPAETAVRRLPDEERGSRGSREPESPAPDLREREPLPATVASQLANLAHALQVHPAKPRTIAFVASSRGEGATTSAANVGSYLAQQRAKVLIVDANLPWPAVHSIAGVSATPGFVDVMDGRLEVKDAIRSTAIANLFVLPAGERESRTTNRLLPRAELRDRLIVPTIEYDYVLVDCPALSLYEDAAVTAAACDGAILVVEGGRTVREQAHAAKALLARAHCQVLGVFMNKRKFYIPQFVYDRL